MRYKHDATDNVTRGVLDKLYKEVIIMGVQEIELVRDNFPLLS